MLVLARVATGQASPTPAPKTNCSPTTLSVAGIAAVIVMVTCWVVAL